jgi:hypothetical protein
VEVEVEVKLEARLCFTPRVEMMAMRGLYVWVPGELVVDVGLTESVDKDVGDGGSGGGGGDQDQDGQEEGATCGAGCALWASVDSC